MPYGLDPSIMMQKTVAPAFGGAVEQGMTIADMMQQRQQRGLQMQGEQQGIQQTALKMQHQQAIQNAFKSATNSETGELDFQKIRPQLYAIDPEYGKEFDQSQGMVSYHNMMAQNMKERSDAAMQNIQNKSDFYQQKTQELQQAHDKSRMDSLSNGLYNVNDPKQYAAMYPHLIEQGYDPKELADPNKPEDFKAWKDSLHAAHPPLGAIGIEQKQEISNKKPNKGIGGASSNVLDPKTEAKLSDLLLKDAAIYKRGTNEGKARIEFDAGTEVEDLLNKPKITGYDLQQIQNKMNLHGYTGAANQYIGNTYSKIIGDPQSELNKNQADSLRGVVQGAKRNASAIITDYLNTIGESKKDQLAKSPNNKAALDKLLQRYSYAPTLTSRADVMKLSKDVKFYYGGTLHVRQ